MTKMRRIVTKPNNTLRKKVLMVYYKKGMHGRNWLQIAGKGILWDYLQKVWNSDCNQKKNLYH